MSDLHAAAARLSDPDATIRSEAMKTIVAAPKSDYDRVVVRALVDGLDHNDYEIQEWATVALRKCKGDHEVIDALWECFRNETKHSARSCALIALGWLGESLGADDLLRLFQERREHPKDLILESAIRWAGMNAVGEQMLLTLREIQEAVAVGPRRDARLMHTVFAALLRSARHGLVEGKVTKPWLKENGFRDILDKLHETRIEKLIKEEVQRLSQSSLPELGPAREDLALTPGTPLQDFVEEQYIQDRAAIQNARLRQQLSIVRDQAVSRKAKERVGYRCQGCGDTLHDPTMARRFVQAHHVVPLSEMGADIEKNVLVLCPSCHARVHAGEIKIEQADAGVKIVPVPMAGDVGAEPEAATGAVPGGRAYRQILDLFDGLAGDTQKRLVVELASRRWNPGSAE